VYLSIQDVEDGLSANISRYFRPTTAFIENVKAQNGKVLVHCWQGVSRSVTIIIAYLMKAEHIKYKRALQLVRQTRPEADPNSHFVEQLKNYEKTLFHE
jgi:protein-tyrosine phosphatase